MKSGLDSLAAIHHIKSKFVCIIKLESYQNDTIWKQRKDYSSKGYLMRFEEVDVKNLDTNDFWKIGYHLIDFKYNENGFLIDYDLKWNGPVNVPSLPDSTQITTKQVFKNNSLEKELVVRTTWYDSYDSYSDTTIISYKENGNISKITKPGDYEESYFYDDKGLLIKIEFSNRKKVFKLEQIYYEFY
ncbi:MAG: hypothetical protein QE487_12035 [Fluviicola sp.]|nr:hypothetical protein [Fluviicola sp.]